MSAANFTTPINVAANTKLVPAIASNKILVVSYDWTCAAGASVSFYAGDPSHGGVLLAGPWTVNINEGRAATAPASEGIAPALIVVPSTLPGGTVPDLWIAANQQIGGVLGYRYQS